MQGSSSQGGDFQTFKRKESVWKRISLLQSATRDDYHSPLLLALGSGEAAPPVHHRKRKRRREAVMQQLSPASVSSKDPVAPTTSEEVTTEEQKNDQQVRPMFPPSCVLEFSAEMAREDVALRKALFVTIVGTRPEVLGAEIIDEVARSFDVEVGAMSIHQAMPEDFILFLPDERVASRVFNGGRIFRGPQFDLMFKRWTRCANAATTSLPALVNVEIRGIPAHAWSRTTTDHLLRDSCIISELHPATALKPDLLSFVLRAWCLDPRNLHRDMTLIISEPGSAAGEKRCLSYKINLMVTPVEASKKDASPWMPS
jgi:hypothetical protein